MAYFRQNYIFNNKMREGGMSWGVLGADESEVGTGLKSRGKLDGFVYGSVREIAHVRYWGIGVGKRSA